MKLDNSTWAMIFAYIGIALLLFASYIMLAFSIPYITASEYARQHNVFEWSGIAFLFAFAIAVIGSLIAFCCGIFSRTLHLRISLIIGGLIYILSCLPLQIFDIRESGLSFLIITFICILPGIACIVGGIIFHKKPLITENVKTFSQ